MTSFLKVVGCKVLRQDCKQQIHRYAAFVKGCEEVTPQNNEGEHARPIPSSGQHSFTQRETEFVIDGQLVVVNAVTHTRHGLRHGTPARGNASMSTQEKSLHRKRLRSFQLDSAVVDVCWIHIPRDGLEHTPALVTVEALFILTEADITIAAQTGQVYRMRLPFPVQRVQPLSCGILVVRHIDGGIEHPISPDGLPVLYTLVHPYQGLRPLRIVDTRPSVAAHLSLDPISQANRSGLMPIAVCAHSGVDVVLVHDFAMNACRIATVTVVDPDAQTTSPFCTDPAAMDPTSLVDDTSPFPPSQVTAASTSTNTSAATVLAQNHATSGNPRSGLRRRRHSVASPHLQEPASTSSSSTPATSMHKITEKESQHHGHSTKDTKDPEQSFFLADCTSGPALPTLDVGARARKSHAGRDSEYPGQDGDPYEPAPLQAVHEMHLQALLTPFVLSALSSTKGQPKATAHPHSPHNMAHQPDGPRRDNGESFLDFLDAPVFCATSAFFTVDAEGQLRAHMLDEQAHTLAAISLSRECADDTLATHNPATYTPVLQSLTLCEALAAFPFKLLWQQMSLGETHYSRHIDTPSHEHLVLLKSQALMLYLGQCEIAPLTVTLPNSTAVQRFTDVRLPAGNKFTIVYQGCEYRCCAQLDLEKNATARAVWRMLMPFPQTATGAANASQLPNTGTSTNASTGTSTNASTGTSTNASTRVSTDASTSASTGHSIIAPPSSSQRPSTTAMSLDGHKATHLLPLALDYVLDETEFAEIASRFLATQHVSVHLWNQQRPDVTGPCLPTPLMALLTALCAFAGVEELGEPTRAEGASLLRHQTQDSKQGAAIAGQSPESLLQQLCTSVATAAKGRDTAVYANPLRQAKGIVSFIQQRHVQYRVDTQATKPEQSSFRTVGSSVGGEGSCSSKAPCESGSMLSIKRCSKLAMLLGYLWLDALLTDNPMGEVPPCQSAEGCRQRDFILLTLIVLRLCALLGDWLSVERILFLVPEAHAAFNASPLKRPKQAHNSNEGTKAPFTLFPGLAKGDWLSFLAQLPLPAFSALLTPRLHALASFAQALERHEELSTHHGDRDRGFHSSSSEEGPRNSSPTSSPTSLLHCAGVTETYVLLELFASAFGTNKAAYLALPLSLRLRVFEFFDSEKVSPYPLLSANAYALLGRLDLALQRVVAPRGRSGQPKTLTPHFSEPPYTCYVRPQKDDVDLCELKISNSLIRMRFPNDKRIEAVAALLNSSKAVSLELEQATGVSDHDFEKEQTVLLLWSVQRTLGLSVGRGMLILSSAFPVLTEGLYIPTINPMGYFVKQRALRSIESADLPEAMRIWPKFHNGVASALVVPPRSETAMTSSWITCQRIVEQEHTDKHAGLLYGLGLLGHLDALSDIDVMEYLQQGHEMITVALLLGLPAGKLGSMDVAIAKKLVIHIPALLPPNCTQVDVTINMQGAALIGMGLLYLGTAHQRTVEVMLAEIGSAPTEIFTGHLNRKSFSLCAGFSLGLILLAKGDACSTGGLEELGLETALLNYIKRVKKPLPSALGANSGVSQQLRGRGSDDMSASVIGDGESDDLGRGTGTILETDGVNTNNTAPAAIVALALIYLKSNNRAIALHLAAPPSVYLLDQVRPDLLLLMTAARSLILWDAIQPHADWISSQLPAILRDVSSFSMESDGFAAFETKLLARLFIQTGACLALGLRYAGTAQPDAVDAILSVAHEWRKTKSAAQISVCRLANINLCMVTVVSAACMVMSGTGCVRLTRLVKEMRAVISDQMTYGHHMLLHMALGLLFLGGGTLTLSRSNKAIAALLMAFYPKVPKVASDNDEHLQALRHMYLLAVEPRMLITRDCETLAPVHVPLKIRFASGDRTVDGPSEQGVSGSGTGAVEVVCVMTPCALPAPVDMIISIETLGERHHKHTLMPMTNRRHHESLLETMSIFVMLKRGCSHFNPHSLLFDRLVGSSSRLLGASSAAYTQPNRDGESMEAVLLREDTTHGSFAVGSALTSAWNNTSSYSSIDTDNRTTISDGGTDADLFLDAGSVDLADWGSSGKLAAPMNAVVTTTTMPAAAIKSLATIPPSAVVSSKTSLSMAHTTPRRSSIHSSILRRSDQDGKHEIVDHEDDPVLLAMHNVGNVDLPKGLAHSLHTGIAGMHPLSRADKAAADVGFHSTSVETPSVARPLMAITQAERDEQAKRWLYTEPFAALRHATSGALSFPLLASIMRKILSTTCSSNAGDGGSEPRAKTTPHGAGDQYFYERLFSSALRGGVSLCDWGSAWENVSAWSVRRWVGGGERTASHSLTSSYVMLSYVIDPAQATTRTSMHGSGYIELIRARQHRRQQRSQHANAHLTSVRGGIGEDASSLLQLFGSGDAAESDRLLHHLACNYPDMGTEVVLALAELSSAIAFIRSWVDGGCMLLACNSHLHAASQVLCEFLGGSWQRDHKAPKEGILPKNIRARALVLVEKLCADVVALCKARSQADVPPTTTGSSSQVGKGVADENEPRTLLECWEGVCRVACAMLWPCSGDDSNAGDDGSNPQPNSPFLRFQGTACAADDSPADAPVLVAAVTLLAMLGLRFGSLGALSSRDLLDDESRGSDFALIAALASVGLPLSFAQLELLACILLPSADQ